MTNLILLKNLDVFLNHLEDESFKSGRNWALALLRKQSLDMYQTYCKIEEIPEVECTADHSAEQWLLIYITCYFSARIVIESSYRYRHAESLINFGVNALEKIKNKFDPAFIDALKKFSMLQVPVCNIDRGIYNNQTKVMKLSGQVLEDRVVAILHLRNQLSHISLPLFDKYLAGQLKAYQSYAFAIKRIASLNQKRWGDVSVLKNDIEVAYPSIASTLKVLEDMKHHVMATDIGTHIPVLRRLVELRNNQSGSLFVEYGRLTISYFARVNHNLTQPFSDFMGQAHKENGCENLSIDALKTADPSLEQMSDIWSGFSTRGLLDTYVWYLPGMVLAFRGGKLEFDVELIYYTTGMFSINFCAQLNGVSASGVRHAMNLGSPQALDEEFLWAGDEKNYAFLHEFAAFTFTELDKFIRMSLQIGIVSDEKTIYYDVSENRFILLLVDRATEKNTTGLRRLSAKSLKQHVAFPALILPQREVRSAIDDWVMRVPPPDDANLAPMCYNRNEILLARRHEAVVVLLEQPNWVREQAAESLRIAAMIIHLFNMANIVLGQRLHQLDKETQGKDNLNRKSIKELGAYRKTLEAELVCLNRFEGDVNRLLGIIEAGSMMTYPDHSELMLGIFSEMGFDGSCRRANQVLSKMKELHNRRAADLEKTYARVKNLMARRMNRLLFGVLALISIGAMKDLFFVINLADMGFVVSGPVQFFITGGVFLIVVITLITGGSRD